MNESDSERIAAVLERSGYKKTQKINSADLIVVNMCSVRQSAVDRIYGLVQKLKKLHPVKSAGGGAKQFNRVKTILTGCILQKDKNKLVKEFNEVIDIKNLTKKIKPKYENKFSAVVPIMTGCNNFCSYCVVPYVRGREISKPSKEIICEIKNLVKRGYKEIWLLGQNVNSYKDKGINFPKLLKMAGNIPGDFWIRFTSSHPKNFSDELIDIMAKDVKITPYLNLPVQAGDNKILNRMNRPYTIGQYKNTVKKVRVKIPNITLSTDIIVGFPEETKKQFENSAKLFKKIKYDMAYISIYSPRSGTTAAKMKDNVSKKEKIRRKRILNEILKKTALEKNRKYIGKTVEVLPIEYENGFLSGKSFHYKNVKFSPYGGFPEGRKVPSSKFRGLIGKFVKVKIINALPWGLTGKMEKPH